MVTKAWLAGDEHDLQYLAAMLPSGDVRIAQDGDRFCLTARQLDAPPSGEQFYEIARKLISQVNGLACIQNADFSPVDLADSYDQDDGVTVVLATARLVVRARMSATAAVTGPDGRPVPQSAPTGPAYLALASLDPDLSQVLKIMAGSPHFAELHKVLEIIEAAGGRDAAMKSAGISKNQVSTFTRTANHQEASGDYSRHARLRQPPPGNPMQITEATSMIRSLVAAWMTSLLAAHRSAGQF